MRLVAALLGLWLSGCAVRAAPLSMSSHRPTTMPFASLVAALDKRFATEGLSIKGDGATRRTYTAGPHARLDLKRGDANDIAVRIATDGTKESAAELLELKRVRNEIFNYLTKPSPNEALRK